MAYTRHGYHIRGTEEEMPRPNLARCGGPSICAECAVDCQIESNKLTPTGENVNPEIALASQIYQRKIFLVEAVQVTEDDMSLTAQWCGGEVVQTPYTDKKHISVPVKRPLNRRQTTAFVGDWVLKANKGFKVYTDKAFKENFELPEPKQSNNNMKEILNG